MVKANAIHMQIMTAWRAWKAHPELHPFMPPVLREKLEKLARTIEPLLVGNEEPSGLERIAETYATTRSMLAVVQAGIRYVYHDRPDILAGLAPLTLGRTPVEDEIRLKFLLGRLERIEEPKFIWLPQLPREAIIAHLKVHDCAQAEEREQEKTLETSAQALRRLRPESHALWSDHGLERWISAFIPPREWPAWGIERRKKPRAAPRKPGEDTAKAGSEASGADTSAQENEAGANDGTTAHDKRGAATDSTPGGATSIAPKTPGPVASGNAGQPAQDGAKGSAAPDVSGSAPGDTPHDRC